MPGRDDGHIPVRRRSMVMLLASLDRTAKEILLGCAAGLARAVLPPISLCACWGWPRQLDKNVHLRQKIRYLRHKVRVNLILYLLAVLIFLCYVIRMIIGDEINSVKSNL